MINSTGNNSDTVRYQKLLSLLPKQHRASGEVPSHFDSLELAVEELLLFAFPQYVGWAGAHDPVFVLGRQVHPATKSFRPVQRG